MNLFGASLGEAQAKSRPEFEILRADVEAHVSTPAIIAITSLFEEDGRRSVASGLARALADSGYRILLIDSQRGNNSTLTAARVDSVAESSAATSEASPYVASLLVGDLEAHRRTNQREVVLIFDLLRTKFDFTLLNVECAVANSFWRSIVTHSNATLVCVEKGRRRTKADLLMAMVLDEISSLFLGLIALNRPVVKKGERLFKFGNLRAEKDAEPREVVRAKF